MAEKVLAAVRVGPGKTEIREYPMPDVPADAALMKMEVAGICGTDVRLYQEPPNNKPNNSSAALRNHLRGSRNKVGARARRRSSSRSRRHHATAGRR